MKKRVNTYLAIAITTYCNYQCFYCKKGGESISKEKETISFDDVKKELHKIRIMCDSCHLLSREYAIKQKWELTNCIDVTNYMTRGGL